jgi:SAM-dependent methyltransferase
MGRLAEDERQGEAHSGMTPESIRPHFDTAQPADFPHVFGSTVCRAEHFLLPLFNYWLRELKMYPAMHRKLWELVFIAQTLHEFGKLEPGMRGLGFGVGQEPLSTYFAKRGIDVLATDLDPKSARASGWVDSGQHAEIPDHLFWPTITDREIFDRHVTFRVLDMNLIPNDLHDFDFCWSACSLEHLGSIDKGLMFIEDSLKTLRPGGVAVHTTEFNLSSDAETIEEGGTVLFRRQDILLLTRLLGMHGHRLLPLCLYAGATDVDTYVDLPPYKSDPHLRLKLGEYKLTSIGVAIVKDGNRAAPPSRP